VSPFGAPRLDLDRRRYAALLKASEVVSHHRQPSELFRILAPLLRWIAPFDFLNFAVADPSRNVMNCYIWEAGEWPRIPVEFKLDDVALGRIWHHHRMLILPDLASLGGSSPEAHWLQQLGIRSYLVFPLATEHERLGELGFGSRRAYAFSGRDVEFLHRAAEMVAVSFDKTLPPETLAQQRERIQLLLGLDAIFGRNTDLQQSIASMLDSLHRLPGNDFVCFYAHDSAAQGLRLHMRDPIFPKRIAPYGVAPFEGTLAGETFRSRKAINLNFSELSQVPFDSVRRGLELGVKSLCMVPVLFKDQALGVLKVASRTDHSLNERDLELLARVSAAIAPDIVNYQARSLLLTGKVKENADDSVPAKGPAPFAGLEDLSDPDRLLAAFFGSSTVGLCILDSELRYLAINNTLAAMNGIPPEAHLGKTVREILGDFGLVIEPELQRVLTTGKPVLSFEVSAMLPTRDELGHWILSYFPIRDTAGTIKEVGAVVVEITEQRKLEQSLRGLTGKLQQEKKRQQVLLEVTTALATNLNVQQVFPKISAGIRRMLRQEFAAYALQDEKSGMLVWQAKDFPLGKGALAEIQLSGPESPGGKALQQAKALIFSDRELAATQGEYSATLRSEGLRSLCCVPLLRPKGPVGVLCLASTRRDAFKTDDFGLLNQIAAQLAVALENQHTAHEIEQLKNRLAGEKQYLEGEVESGQPFEEIIGESPALKQVLRQVETVAASGATVLILGETGTGKELIAHALHRMSQRVEKNFVKLNCAAIPTGLLESELFGHEKGAFTGAISQKVGRMELADKGTLFLDEVGEIPLELQPKLLRVLQDHEFERLGSTKTIRVDLRLIAATNRNLAESVARHEFRSDLFYRLNVFPIRIPALRERRGDIPLLVRHLVHKFSREMNKKIETVPTETMNTLINWDWPGNVRELENLIERSVILTEGRALHVPIEELRAGTLGKGVADNTLENAEREHIIRVLRETGGRMSGPGGAAHRLGLKRTTLQSKMQKLKITRHDYSIASRE